MKYAAASVRPGSTRVATAVSTRPRMTAEEVEARLEEMDRELLALCEEGLDPRARQAVEDRLRTALETLAVRLPREELDAAAGRLREQILRERIPLPVLSLFSPLDPDA